MVPWAVLVSVSLFLGNSEGLIPTQYLEQNDGSSNDIAAQAVVCPEPNGVFSHPKYCDQFVHCGEGLSPTVSKCSHGLMFNSNSSLCDYPSNVDCEGRVDSRPEDEKDSRCLETYGTFPVQNNCTLFVVCEGGKVSASYMCTPGLAYNSTLGVCAEPEDPSCLEVMEEPAPGSPPIEDSNAGSSTSRPPPELNPDLIIPARPTKPPTGGGIIPNWPRSHILTIPQLSLNLSAIPIFYLVPLWQI